MPIPGVDYFIDVRTTEPPLAPSELFDDKGKIFLEIGFGRGEFLERLARSTPQAGFIGIEMSLTSVRKLLRRLHETELSNVRVILADASFVVRRLFRSNSFAGVFMNFPCPWPKKRHARYRLSRERFIGGLACVLKKGAFFELMTDSKSFLMEVSLRLSESSFFKKIQILENPPSKAGTKYEIKWKAEHRDLYKLTAVKSSHPEECETLRGDLMPHLKIPRSGFSAEALKRVTAKPLVTKHAVVIYKTVYSSTENGEHIIDTVTNEDGFEQRFFIKVVEGHDEVLIKLFSTGLPFRTEGVKTSVIELGRLVSAPDEARLDD